MVPTNVSPQQAQKMITASNAFRYFDKDHSGTLSQAGNIKYIYILY